MTHAPTSLAPLGPQSLRQPTPRRGWSAIWLTAAVLPALVACAEVVNEAKVPDSHGLIVNGTGRAVADPDVAVANIGVEVRDASAQLAVESNNKQMSLLVTNLKGLGIQDADLQTSNFSISYERPPVDWRNEAAARPTMERAEERAPDDKAATTPATPRAAQPEGWFVVNNTLRVKVRDLNRLGDVLSTATAAGANSIWGVELQLDNPDPLLAEARDKAIQDALAKAQRLAATSGVQLGEILSIQEHGGSSPGPQAAGMLCARDAKSSVPIEAGSLELNAGVTIRFELTKAGEPREPAPAP